MSIYLQRALALALFAAALLAALTYRVQAEEASLICPQVIPLAVKECHQRGQVPCAFGHKAQYGHDYTLIEFDSIGLIMQGSFKGVLIDYDSDGIVDRQPTLFGGYDSRKNASGRNGTLHPTGKFSAAQEVYEDECKKLVSLFLPEAVAMATDPPVE